MQLNNKEQGMRMRKRKKNEIWGSDGPTLRYLLQQPHHDDIGQTSLACFDIYGSPHHRQLCRNPV